MKKIFLIATGGTIASREGKNGLTPELSLEQLLQYVPQIRELCRIKSSTAHESGQHEHAAV